MYGTKCISVQYKSGIDRSKKAVKYIVKDIFYALLMKQINSGSVADPGIFKTGQLRAWVHNCPVLMNLKYAESATEGQSVGSTALK